MKRKQVSKPAAPLSPPAGSRKPARKGNASQNKAQAGAVLRSQKAALRASIVTKNAAAREARTPAAMIAALDQIRPLGQQLADSEAGKAAWDVVVNDAVRAWKGVAKAPLHTHAKGPARRDAKEGGDGGEGRDGSDGRIGSGAPKGGLPPTTHAGEYIDVVLIGAPPAPFAPAPYPSAKTIAIAKQAGADVGAAAGGAADDAGDAAHDAADAAHDAADAAHDAAEDGADAAHDAAEEGAGAAKDAAEDAGNNASDTVSSWLHH
jgi:hypothetical protein